ncbi:hypothetical protein LguiA_013063 [Lonicera macranthoides]
MMRQKGKKEEGGDDGEIEKRVCGNRTMVPSRLTTIDGKSRQFGFVGFRSEKEAVEALKFFNNSYMDTCRITCEIARKVGDPDIPRPWSRHSLKKQEKLVEETKKATLPKSLSLKKTNGEKKENENDDPQLEEFLQVLERAKEGESLEELRARTAAQFTNEQNGFQNPGKLWKKRKNMPVLDEAPILLTAPPPPPPPPPPPSVKYHHLPVPPSVGSAPPIYSPLSLRSPTPVSHQSSLPPPPPKEKVSPSTHPHSPPPPVETTPHHTTPPIQQKNTTTTCLEITSYLSAQNATTATNGSARKGSSSVTGRIFSTLHWKTSTSTTKTTTSTTSTAKASGAIVDTGLLATFHSLRRRTEQQLQWRKYSAPEEQTAMDVTESLANKDSSLKEVEADPSVEAITYKLVQDVTNKCEKLRRDSMLDQACCKELFEAEQRLYRLQATFSKKVELERKQEKKPSLGFAFCPDEREIITRYLMIRCMGNARTSCPIETELDVYAKDPRELIGKYPRMGKHGWHFYTRGFVEKDQLDANENQGQWKTCGEKDIVFCKGEGVGSKRALEYFEGGQRTKYKIIEYNLDRNKYDVCVCKLYEEGSSCSCVEYNLKKKSLMATTRSGMESLGNTATSQKKFKVADGAAASLEQEQPTEMDVTDNLSNRTASQREAEAEPSVENITYEYLQNLTEKCNELRRSAMFDRASLDKYHEVEPMLHRCEILFSKKDAYRFPLAIQKCISERREEEEEEEELSLAEKLVACLTL